MARKLYFDNEGRLVVETDNCKITDSSNIKFDIDGGDYTISPKNVKKLMVALQGYKLFSRQYSTVSAYFGVRDVETFTLFSSDEKDNCLTKFEEMSKAMNKLKSKLDISVQENEILKKEVEELHKQLESKVDVKKSNWFAKLLKR